MKSPVRLISASVLVVLLGVGLLALLRFDGIPTTKPTPGKIQAPHGATAGVPGDNDGVISPDTSEALATTAAATTTALADLGLTENELATVSDGVVAGLGLLGPGDIESYLAYWNAYGGTLSPAGEAVADQQFQIAGLPDIDQQQWASMGPLEKFAAIAGRPDVRGASILKIDTSRVRVGEGPKSDIPEGFRNQGMRSAFHAPSPDLFTVGADTPWIWAEYPVSILQSDDAILRFEFAYDSTVGAWLLQRASLLAPSSIRLPWIVF